MAKGHYFHLGGLVYKTTTTEAKRLLKAVIKGTGVVLQGADELAPVIDLDKLDKDAAWEEFKKIEVGE